MPVKKFLFDKLVDPRYSSRVNDLESLRQLSVEKDYANVSDVAPVSIFDMEGKPIVTSMSDRTDAGGLLTRIGDVDLKDPVRLQGGQGYMFNDGLWASDTAPVNQIYKLAGELKKQTGVDPVFAPFRMAPTGGDYAHMTGQTMLSYAQSAMTKAQKKELNKELKKIIPDWKSIDDPKYMDVFNKVDGKTRKKVIKMMDKSFRKNGGLSAGQARLAVTEQQQVNAPDAFLQNVGQMDLSAARGTSPHTTYKDEVKGQGIGQFAEDIPVYALNPQRLKMMRQGTYRDVKDPFNPTAPDKRALQMSPMGTVITENLLRHLEDLGVKPAHLKATAKVAIAGGALAAGEANAGMFGSLVKLGYPESTARKIADGVLPMDTESRIKRATEQGYNLKVFHTGSGDILNLDPTEARSFDTAGTGFWSSDSPELSSSYARIGAEDSPAMYPMLLKTDGMYSADAGGSLWSRMGDAVYRDADGNVLDVPFVHTATTDNFANDARKRGASGLIIDNVVDTGPDYKSMRAAIEGQGKNYMDFLADYQKKGVRNVSVQDPSAARSLLGAAFDPDQTGSSNILASRAVPTAAAGLLGLSALGQSDDAEAARIPKNVVEGYKLFRTKPDDEGLYPLFVDSNTPVNVGEWTDAKAGEMAKDGKKVKSKIGPLAYRAGWHAGDMPMATHIGGKSESGLKAPDYRPASQQWAKIQMGDDYDWQTEAIKRAGRTKDGRIKAVEAHITDQIPEMGHYRYKTNPNMTGEWLIGGEMKVTDLLSPEQVGKIGTDTGFPDLPILPEVIKKKGLKFDDLTAEAKKELKQYYPEVYANMTGTKAAPKISAFSGVGAPVAGGGLLALGLTPDDARAAEIAATDTRDVGSIEATKSDTASDLATLMRSYNRKVYNDPLLGMVSPKLPANLFDRMAYNEDIEASDILKGYAGLLGFDFD